MNIRLLFFAAFALCFSTGLATGQHHDLIYYASLNYAIHQGQFDGVTSVHELKKYGDFGVGSESRLASELVVLDGVFYGIPGDGKLQTLNDGDSIAFASIKFFKADTTFHIGMHMTLEELEKHLSTIISQNKFAAVKVHATFAEIEYRSFFEQAKPYQPIESIEEVLFHKEEMIGTMVGFYTPESAEVLNSPVYHFHFVDEDRETGGHVQQCKIISAEVEIDYATELQVLLPPRDAVEHVDLNEPVKSKGDK